MTVKKSPKTAWIIDGAYLQLAAPNEARTDFFALEKELEIRSNSHLRNAHYFNGRNPFAHGFYSVLQAAPPNGLHMKLHLYDSKSWEDRCDVCNTVRPRQGQKGVDVGIATLAIKEAHQNMYDRLLLIAGDRDFVDAVKYIANGLGKEVWIVGFAGTMSTELQSAADNVIWIDDFWEQIQLRAPLARAA